MDGYCCGQGSICFEMMKGVPAAFVTLIIGGIAAGITWRQYQVAKAKLKLDLFEKRYAIFHKTWVILSEVIIEGVRKHNYGLATPFNNFLPEASFLFGNDIETYLSEITKKWTDYRALEIENDDRGIPQENIEKRRELRNWFEAQASRGVKEKFGHYLNFEMWK